MCTLRAPGVEKTSQEFLTKEDLEKVFQSLEPKEKGFNASQRKIWETHTKAVIDGYMGFVESVVSKDGVISSSHYHERIVEFVNLLDRSFERGSYAENP